VEYALIVALVTVGVVAILRLLGNSIGNVSTPAEQPNNGLATAYP
jgi:Flp pilus assembly pilin Flp